MSKTKRGNLYNGFSASNITSTEYKTFKAADVVVCVLGLTYGVSIMGSVKQGALSKKEAEDIALANAMQALELQQQNVNSTKA